MSRLRSSVNVRFFGGLLRSPRLCCWKGHSAGFTLLEVLVALAVVGLALAAVIKAASLNASNAAYLRDKTFAHWVAMNRVTEFQLQPDTVATGRRGGVDEMAGRDWFWRVRVRTTLDPRTRRLEVEVRAQEQADDPLVRLVAFVSV